MRDAVLSLVGNSHSFANVPLLGFALFVGHLSDVPGRMIWFSLLFDFEKLEVRATFVRHLKSYWLDANIAESLKRFAEL